MKQPPGAGQHMTFVIRVTQGPNGLRGQVVAVASGTSRLFDGLQDAVAFIEAAVDEREDRSLRDAGGRRPGGELT